MNPFRLELGSPVKVVLDSFSAYSKVAGVIQPGLVLYRSRASRWLGCVAQWLDRHLSFTTGSSPLDLLEATLGLALLAYRPRPAEVEPLAYQREQLSVCAQAYGYLARLQLYLRASPAGQESWAYVVQAYGGAELRDSLYLSEEAYAQRLTLLARLSYEFLHRVRTILAQGLQLSETEFADFIFTYKLELDTLIYQLESTPAQVREAYLQRLDAAAGPHPLV